MRYVIAVVAFATLFISIAFAQIPQTASCRYPKINVQGTSNADVAVSNTAVIIMLGNGNRCTAVILNTGTGDMRCAPDTAFTPTATTGILIKAGVSLTLSGAESVRQWQCIRTASTDTTANVLVTETQ